jgi:hypothetical protein
LTNRRASRAATNIARDKPRKISPPTIRGEENIPLMIILHASVCIHVEAGYCSRQEGKDSKRERR